MVPTSPRSDWSALGIMHYLPTRTYEDSKILNTIVQVELKGVEGFSNVKYIYFPARALLEYLVKWDGMDRPRSFSDTDLGAQEGI